MSFRLNVFFSLKFLGQMSVYVCHLNVYVPNVLQTNVFQTNISWQSVTQLNVFLSKDYHVRYLSHLALQVGSSHWVHKTRIDSIQRWHHFGAIISWSGFLLEKQLHPFLYWIKYSWSGSTNILYYINLSVGWNKLLRNQISLCQRVFYYKTQRLQNVYEVGCS